MPMFMVSSTKHQEKSSTANVADLIKGINKKEKAKENLMTT